MVSSAIEKEIKELNKSCVKIKDRAKVELLIKKLISDGPDKLQVISDFDFTITKQHVNGKKQLSSFSLFNHCKGLPPNFGETNKDRLSKYGPIESDPNLTKAEKLPFMVEFYHEKSKAYSGFKFSPNQIKEVAELSLVELRDGTSDLVYQLDAHNIPMLVFSAGLGNMVTAVLEHNKVLRSNVHVVSNFFQFKDDCVDGFQKDMIHPLNKNASAASHSPYFKDMADRSNILLLGDTVGDDEMAEGVPNTAAVLKIGFLFPDREDLLPIFLDHFDVVLFDDQTMDLPNAIVKACIEQSKTK